MIVKLRYGDDRVNVDLRGLRVRPLAPAAPAGQPDPAALVAAALDSPLAGSDLAALARGARTATVVVPDATRNAALPQILPIVLARLLSAGIEPDAITLLVATGTHPPVGRQSVAELVGTLAGGVTVLEHDSRDDGSLVEVGELRRDLPLRLHRRAVEADLLITVGAVSHHYFAGFGGGPKMIFPGIAGHDEIQANHALVLEAVVGDAWRRHPGCEPGRLAGNPVAEEIARAAALCPPAMAVCLAPGRDGGISWAVAGPWEPAFEAAVSKVRSWFEVGEERLFDLMVAGAGGAPKDRTLIQAHKALDAACRFLVPGGELLFAAALDRGPGSPAMTPFLDDPRPDAILERLARGWVQYGHTTLRLVEKTSRFRVQLFSDLDPDLARRLGFHPVADLDTSVDRWRTDRPGARVGVMAAGSVYPRA